MVKLATALLLASTHRAEFGDRRFCLAVFRRQTLLHPLLALCSGRKMGSTNGCSILVTCICQMGKPSFDLDDFDQFRLSFDEVMFRSWFMWFCTRRWWFRDFVSNVPVRNPLRLIRGEWRNSTLLVPDEWFWSIDWILTEFQRRVVSVNWLKSDWIPATSGRRGNGLLDGCHGFLDECCLWIGINTGLYRMNIFVSWTCLWFVWASHT
jgi:hypothetical protein